MKSRFDLRCCLSILIAIASFTIYASNTRADAPQLLGGVDVGGYCETLGHSDGTLTKDPFGPNAAYHNWQCITVKGDTRPFSFVQACKWQYDLDRGVQARPLDHDDAFSWRCYSTQN
jgi:hypothetical protein